MARNRVMPDGGDEPLPAPGHSVRELGPSDISDSGSDLVGAPGLAGDAGFDDNTGTTSDLDLTAGAGLDIGDPNYESDSDSGGTGERMSAGRDGASEGGDIGPDRVTRHPGGLVEGEDPEGIGVTRRRK